MTMSSGGGGKRVMIVGTPPQHSRPFPPCKLHSRHEHTNLAHATMLFQLRPLSLKSPTNEYVTAPNPAVPDLHKL